MPAGSVHFSSRAPIGHVVISAEPLATNQGFKSVVPAAGVLKDYIYYYLLASREFARERATGTTFLELSGKAFGLLPIPVPPTAMQRRIVAKIEELFSELDKGVESLKTARAQMKTYRQALLKHAFEGKLTADWREKNKDKLETPKQLLARVKRDREGHYQRQLDDWRATVEAWQDSGKLGKKPVKPRMSITMAELPNDANSGLPSLPHGWCWIRLGDVSEVSGGLTKNQKRLHFPRKMKYLRVANVYADEIKCDEVREIGVTDAEAIANELQQGDLLVVEGNGSISQIGRVAMWNGQLPHCGHQNHLIRVRVLKSFVPRFFLQFLLSPIGRELIVAEANSTSGLHTLSISKVSNLVVPIASLIETAAVISKLDELLSSFDKAMEDIDAVLGESEGLRQSILKKAFSGQLVPQDPNDEPASILLERIGAERAAQPQNKTRKRKRPKAATT